MSTPRAIKLLERKAKAAVMRLMALAFGARRQRTPPNWSVGSRRVLFIRHDGIGDVLMSTPLLRAIARAHPNLSVDVLTFPGPADALRGLPFIRVVHAFRPGRRLT